MRVDVGEDAHIPDMVVGLSAQYGDVGLVAVGTPGSGLEIGKVARLAEVLERPGSRRLLYGLEGALEDAGETGDEEIREGYVIYDFIFHRNTSMAFLT